MASGFFSRLAELGEVIPDDEAAPSIFSTALFGFGSNASQGAATAGADITPIIAGNGGDGGGGAGAGSPTHIADTATRGECDAQGSAALQRSVTELTRKLHERTQQYKDLLEEAATVRAESDAYRRKAEAQRRQERQRAQESARMLEELRRAGAAGRVDEVYVEGLQKKVTELELQLRDAMAETQTAVRRQREAEEQRKLVETEKRDEVAELAQRYDQILERVQQRQEQLEAQLAAARARRSDGEDRNEADEAEGSSGDVHAEGAAPASSLAAAAAETSSYPSTPEATGTSVAAAPYVTDGDGTTMTTAAAGASTKEVAALQRQVAQLRACVKDLEREAAAAEEHARRQLDEAAADAVETQRRLAEKTTDLDAARAQLAELQSATATRDDEHGAREKELLFQVRELEDAAAKLRRERQEMTLAAERVAQEHAEALQKEREKAARTVARVDEAESTSKAVTNTLEAQRAHFEAQLQARDATIMELTLVRRTLEQAVQEGRDDARRQTDVLEQLRRDLAQRAAQLREMEGQHMHSQRLLSLREEELQSREAERQRIRAVLREEEEAHTAARQALSYAATRIEELEAALQEGEAALQAAQSASGARDATLAALTVRCEELEQRLADKEAAVAPLEQRLAELQAANLRLREEAVTATRRLENQIRELQRSGGDGGTAGAGEASALYGPGSTRLAVLAAAESAGSGQNARYATTAASVAAAVDPTVGFKYLAPPTSRERYRFMQDAVQSAHHFTVQARTQKFRIVFGTVVLGVVVLMLLLGVRTASTVSAHDELRLCELNLSFMRNRLHSCDSTLTTLQDRCGAAARKRSTLVKPVDDDRAKGD